MPSDKTFSSTIRLGDLIDAIGDTDFDPLQQLSEAVAAGEYLGDLADALIGHFVDQARRAGASWTAIGQSMGVSKQAAQKRFVGQAPQPPESGESNPFARFTPRARNAVISAHNLAIAEGSSHVTSALVARGVLAENRSLGVTTLAQLGVDVDAMTQRLAGSTGGQDDDREATAFVPYDDAAKVVLEDTVQIALRLGHNYVGTEHLLIALFADLSVGPVFTESGVTAEAFEHAVVEQLQQFIDR
ncbi:Clp protease N-terminal domain-containing protein [Williamsia sterculiae]|uniref:Clp amino terminal domain-containing protein, pathogenicity island component n=1 Tax=Williamsia sterculiae TaxID=1344003 RepID=A0A1N7DKA8_9NOCA|nr:Clp protease N-terminal domain-containing protein [Williamsia sterculiae]SIR76272.1 Clp amino terminal domain-containing protein, pathogenicity island component [Williamsia sterculiae]